MARFTRDYTITSCSCTEKNIDYLINVVVPVDIDLFVGKTMSIVGIEGTITQIGSVVVLSNKTTSLTLIETSWNAANMLS